MKPIFTITRLFVTPNSEVVYSIPVIIAKEINKTPNIPKQHVPHKETVLLIQQQIVIIKQIIGQRNTAQCKCPR
jgi:nitric oxide reductase large subunit